MDVYFHPAYVCGGDAELSAGTPLRMIYALTLSIPHSIAPTCGLLANGAVERSGKMWASHNFRYCPSI